MHSLQGAVGSPALTDLLLSLHDASRTGRLRVSRDGVWRDLWVKDGVLIGAESSAEGDALESLLLTADLLTRERHDAVRARIEAGARRGPALVESAHLSPSQLVEWTGRRARFLARDILCWGRGEYAFEEGEAPPEGAIPTAIPIRGILLETLRDAGPARARAADPDGSVVPRGTPCNGDAIDLLPEEAYVLSLADGRRSVAEISRMAEFGSEATTAILARLMAAGLLRPHAERPAEEMDGPRAGDPAAVGADGDPDRDRGIGEWIDLPAGDSQNTLRAIIRMSNDLFVTTGAYLGREIGPISEHLLDKALRDARAQHPALLHRVAGTRDGSLPEETLIRNIGLIKEHDPRACLLSGLESYLGGILLLVRRYLGPEHERSLRDRARELKCPGV